MLGPLPDIIQADRKWQERPDRHGHQHPGSPGSKRVKSSLGSTWATSISLQDLELKHTLYNTGMSALVHLELKEQGGFHRGMLTILLLLYMHIFSIINSLQGA